MLRRRCFTVAALASTTSLSDVAGSDAAFEQSRARSWRRGFTILELLVVFTVAGVLIAITGKGIATAFTGNSRSSAVRIVGSTLFQARAIAIQRSSKSTLVRSGNTMLIYADSLGTRVQLGLTTDLNQRTGVTLSSSVTPTTSRDSVMFDARGLLIGTTTTYKIIITKGTKSDTVCVTGLGNTRGRGC